MKTESYVYTEPRTVAGHKIGERVVHVLPKGTLHDPKGTAKARQAAQERVEAMYATPGVIHARAQGPERMGYSQDPFKRDYVAPGDSERTLGTARGVGKRW